MAQPLTKSRGANPNIKQGMSSATTVRPKSRGEVCELTFDNYTGMFIQCYVDGNYQCTVGPWGKVRVNIAGGYTNVYYVNMADTQYWKGSGECDVEYNYDLR